MYTITRVGIFTVCIVRSIPTLVWIICILRACRTRSTLVVLLLASTRLVATLEVVRVAYGCYPYFQSSKRPIGCWKPTEAPGASRLELRQPDSPTSMILLELVCGYMHYRNTRVGKGGVSIPPSLGIPSMHADSTKVRKFGVPL